MRILNLKVSPLSKKILLREYPVHELSETIIANSHTLLYKQIFASLPFRSQKIDVLTENISIACSKLKNLDDDDLNMVGLMIHQEHRYACMRWIQSTVASGETASHGIRTFFDHYDLMDEDLNYESVFRQWQRYVRKNVDLLHKPKEDVLNRKNIASKILRSGTVNELDEDRFAHFCADIVEYLYNSNQKWNHNLVRNLKLTIHSQVCFLRHINYLEKYNEKTIYKAISRTRRWIDKHHKVRAAYLKYFGPDAASSQHDHQGHRVDTKPMRT